MEDPRTIEQRIEGWRREAAEQHARDEVEKRKLARGNRRQRRAAMARTRKGRA